MNDIKIQVLSAYKEYVDNGFPEDPAVYFISANDSTTKSLRELHVEYITKLPSHLEDTAVDRFLSFLIRINNSIPTGEITFGPETITLKYKV